MFHPDHSRGILRLAEPTLSVVEGLAQDEKVLIILLDAGVRQHDAGAMDGLCKAARGEVATPAGVDEVMEYLDVIPGPRMRSPESSQCKRRL